MATETSERTDTGAVIDGTRRPFSPGVRIATSVAGLLLLAVVGWVAWNHGALVGLRFVEFDSPVSLAALGFLAGIGGFFAPCAFALFPGYVSYYLSASGDSGSVRRSLGLGVACAAGSTLFFALIGIAITLVGGAISPYLIATKPAIALAVVALGVVQVLDVRMPSLALPLGVTCPSPKPHPTQLTTADALATGQGTLGDCRQEGRPAGSSGHH